MTEQIALMSITDVWKISVSSWNNSTRPRHLLPHCDIFSVPTLDVILHLYGVCRKVLSCFVLWCTWEFVINTCMSFTVWCLFYGIRFVSMQLSIEKNKWGFVCYMFFLPLRYTTLVVLLSGRTSVSDRRTFTGLHPTCSWWVTIYMAVSRPTQLFILSGLINE